MLAIVNLSNLFKNVQLGYRCPYFRILQLQRFKSFWWQLFCCCWHFVQTACFVFFPKSKTYCIREQRYLNDSPFQRHFQENVLRWLCEFLHIAAKWLSHLEANDHVTNRNLEMRCFYWVNSCLDQYKQRYVMFPLSVNITCQVSKEAFYYTTASHSDNDTLNKKTDFCLHRLHIGAVEPYW